MIKVLKNIKYIKADFIRAMFLVVLNQLIALGLPLMMSLLINNGITKGDVDYIKQYGAIMLGLAFVGTFVAITSSYFSSKTAMGFGRLIREKIFLKVETLSQSDIDKVGTPSIINRSTSDIKVMQDFILQSLRMIISAPIMLIGGSIMAFVMNAKLALIVFAAIPIVALVTFILYKTVLPLFKKRQLMTDEVTRFLRQKLGGIRVIRAFNTTEYEDERFEERNTKLSEFIVKFSRIMATLIPSCIVIVIILLDLLIYVAVKSIDSLTDPIKIQNSIGDLQAFVIYMIMVIGAISVAAAMFVIVPRANISAKRIAEILDIEPMIKDSENPVEIIEDKKGEIEFKHVSFAYDGDLSRPALSDVCFTAEKGKTTAIIGATGSGKSTLIKLISRFYDVNEGEILFGGVNIKDISQDNLHSRIGYVPQKIMLFSGSIRDNLLYGDENADEERLQKAIEIAQAKEFIDTLPDGIDSFVTQNATNYSGGQKQRISIARALVRDADVYVFDDSFSALDFKTDSKLRLALKNNIDSTVIIVAQRVGTIMNADKIIVLDGGKIAAQGTHKQLIQSSEIYREIALSQLSRKEVFADE